MKFFQVGGAVRDALLNAPFEDVDHLVVGATEDEMLELGFLRVGKNFPVFLHPETREEYALARKEVKTGPKHTDFEFIFDPSITIEEDVLRRDFTVNALLKDEETGEIVDLVGGLDDLKNKVLRHVDSKHFPEDPLRVLRMCRFSAKLGFSIAPETMALAQHMVERGDLNHLSPERIWQEFYKALNAPRFHLFIENLRVSQALKVLLPEIEKLFSVPEKVQYHPEKNAGAHTLLALQACENEAPLVKWAVLLHDVGKSTTNPKIWPSHYGHDKRGVTLIQKISQRLKVPKKFADFAGLSALHHMRMRDVNVMRLKTVFRFTGSVSSTFKNKAQMEAFFSVCKADMLGRALPLKAEEFESLAQAVVRVRTVFKKMQSVKATDMPNFEQLKKDSTFKDVFETYALDCLKGC